LFVVSTESVTLSSLLAVIGVQALAALAVTWLHRFEDGMQRALPYVISVAIGVLLTTGAAHLLPESVEALGNRSALWIVFVLTMLTLYAFERIFHLLSGVSAEPCPTDVDCGEDHAHDEHHHHHHASRPATLLIGCVTHSLVDGTSVAAAFTVGAHIGWITALAVGLHEIPHRMGDFALLVHMGMARNRAALLAIGAGGSALLGWALVAALGSSGSGKVAWLLPISAASFLYISLVDLLPELQEETNVKKVIGQLVCLTIGVALALGLTQMRGA
jgi:zinc and cadmium transporter